jgi:hypothetical protein
MTPETMSREAIDLHDAQEALRQIVRILDATKPGPNVFYEIGRAIGTARYALAVTGAKS